MQRKKTPKDVDAYIASAPKEARSKLVQLRKIVKAVAPKAHEGVNYEMPYYKYHGALVGFAAFTNHIGFFMAVAEEHKQALKGYETTKGTVRFPISKPLPITLIKKMLKARIERNDAGSENCLLSGIRG